MATVLFAWELGGGLGHLMQMLPLARGLAARGHTVYAALRDLPKVESVFGPGPVRYLPAPYMNSPVKRPIQPPITFSHLLHNCGFGDLPELRTLTTAWRNLIHLVRPDVVVFDHSPTALLASRVFGENIRRVVVGSGFCVPPDPPAPPLLLRPWRNPDPARLMEDERTLLDRINTLLAEWRRPPLRRVLQIYSEADDHFLVTFAEMDHFQDRAAAGGSAGSGAVYRGAWTEGRGKRPQWPGAGAGAGKRVYAYLKDFPALPALLEALGRSGHPTIVYADGMPPAMQRRFASENVRFETSALHLADAVRECDLAVLNSGHGTTAAMLLAGKPALLVPIYLEQGLLAKAVVRNTGAAVDVPYKDGARVVAGLEEMLATDRCANAAVNFAAKYARLDAAEETERMVDRMEQLVGAVPHRVPAFDGWSHAPVG